MVGLSQMISCCGALCPREEKDGQAVLILRSIPVRVAQGVAEVPGIPVALCSDYVVSWGAVLL